MKSRLNCGVILLCVLFSCTNSRKKSNDRIEIIQENGKKWIRKYYGNSNTILSEGGIIGDTTKNGIFRIYNPDRTVYVEQYFKRGNADGIYRAYYESDDSNFVEKEGLWRDDKQIGTWKFYYPNGNLETINIFDSSGNLKYTALFNRDGRFDRDSPSTCMPR